MLQIRVSVVSRQNGSMKAVSGTGLTSMSDSLIAFQPRMLAPLKPSPSSNVASSRFSAGIVKCCHWPGKSMNRRSTALTSRSRMRARISRGVIGPLGERCRLRVGVGGMQLARRSLAVTVELPQDQPRRPERANGADGPLLDDHLVVADPLGGVVPGDDLTGLGRRGQLGRVTNR